MHKFIDITGRTNGQVVGVGAMVGAFAFFFSQYIPLLTTMRKQYPDAILVAAGETANWWYVRNLCDYYIAVDVNPSITLGIGWNADMYANNDNLDLEDKNLQKIIIDNLGRCDSFMELQYPPVVCAQIYQTMCTSMRPLGYELNIPYNPKSKKVAIWGRKKPDTRSATNGYVDHFYNTIDLLIDKGFTPVVCGKKGFSRESHRDDVINLLDVAEMSRAERHTREMAECLFSINTATSSMEYTLFVPTPSLIFDVNPRDECLYRVHRNFFDAPIKVYNPVEWPDPMNWKWPAPGAQMQYKDYADGWINALDDFTTFCQSIQNSKSYGRELSRPEGLASHQKLDWKDLVHFIPNRDTAKWPKV